MSGPITYYHERTDRRLHAGERRRLLTYLHGGISNQEIAALCGVSAHLVWQIRNGFAWKTASPTTTPAHQPG